MLTAIGDFARRRKSLFVWTAAATGGAYLLGKYAINRIEELSKRSELDRLAQQNIKRRFEQNQQDCTLTILSLLPSLAEYLLQSEKMDVESLTIRLKQGVYGTEEGADPATVRQRKLQLWQELKLKSIARTVGSLYAVVLLTVLLRVQLNLIGRYTYLESLDVLDGNGNGAKMKANEQQQQQEHLKVKRISKFLSFESEQKYLCVSWFLIHRGSRNLVDMLLQITEKVFGGVELGQKLSFEQFKDLLDRIRQEIEQPNPSMIDYVFPPKGQEAYVIRSGMVQAAEDDDSSPITIDIDSDLQRLLDETREIMQSEEYASVIKCALNAAFDRLLRTLDKNLFAGKSMNSTAAAASEPKIVELPDDAPGRPLASFLPEITKAAHSILNCYPNEHVKDLAELTPLNALAAVIYCRFDDGNIL